MIKKIVLVFVVFVIGLSFGLMFLYNYDNINRMFAKKDKVTITVEPSYVSFSTYIKLKVDSVNK